MSATRTQIYLTREQRARLDARGKREDRSLAELIREAVDRYLQDAPEDPKTVLAATFGACPDLRTPSRDEWEGRHR